MIAPADHGAAAAPAAADAAVEVSVVMPCLNEADTLVTCIRKARQALQEHGIAGEVIIADNGSTDDSPALATAEGARVVMVETRGYGAALMGGIAEARGRFVIMGDADDSYDFGEIPTFVTKLREGFDLVQGCRLPAGGGHIVEGAMPFLHRVWGNPMFTWMVRRWFWAPVHDVYCGLRGFTKDFYEGLDQRCTGMEFATEMIIKAGVFNARVAEVPITLYPDGRKAHAPHLKTFRDGWRTLRFFLLYSPRWLFYQPGLLLLALGFVGYGLALPGVRVGRFHFDAHTLLFASLSLICGYQALLFAIHAKTFAVTEGLLPARGRIQWVFEHFDLERGLVGGALGILAGLALLAAAVLAWRARGYGDLDYAVTMRVVIPGVTLTTLGFQTILGCFFLSILGLRRR